MTAKAERQDAKPALGEEVQKVRIPAPGALEGAVHKEQRMRVLCAGLTLID
jgi:hypothetical protein